MDSTLIEIEKTIKGITKAPWKWDLKEKQEDGEIMVQYLSHWEGKSGEIILEVMDNQYGVPVINGWNRNDIELIENAPYWMQYTINKIRELQEEIHTLKNNQI